MSDHDRFYWARVTQVARAALPAFVAGEQTPTEAVTNVGRGLGPAKRADAAWMVELIADRLDDKEREELAATVQEGSA